ncbi:MAG: uracil-DNA glycosylase [Flavobacteriaceae bacterium]
MKVSIHKSWEKELKSVFEESFFHALVENVKYEYSNNICYPHGKFIFKAFDDCPFDKIKVVIIGQDPYHGIGQANGLCFSVKDKIQHPPSLVNIFKEIEKDLNIPYPISGDLTRWSKQGVLLLNSVLTVKANSAGSHKNIGWQKFTDTVINTVSKKKNNIVFLLWGGYAKEKSKLIDQKKHLILKSVHPSPLSANRGGWFGNKHFSTCNHYLYKKDIKQIDW